MLGLEPDDQVVERLSAYYDLLQRWNEKINLTSLPDSDEALDRLVMEPLAAATRLPAGARLIDIGSGGGSPAIPLAVALGSPSVTMIESRGRKVAFLREALRTLSLDGQVESDRAEQLHGSDKLRGSADVVSLRAVRMTPELAAGIAGFLSDSGVLALFSNQTEAVPAGFQASGAYALVPATHAFLHVFRRG
jgi:16S rRNA (guanine527-N7)-methyltransferase